jgi:hypothetical protein
LAELFSFYCLDDINFRSVYFKEVAFMVSFVKDYASKNGMPEIEALQKFLTANANQDYKLMKELVSTYKENAGFVNKINNTRREMGVFSNREDLSEAAAAGGFSETYESFLQTGKVKLDGLKGWCLK